jgi:hypothetical protein
MLLEMNVKLRRGHFDLTTRLSITTQASACSANPAPVKARYSV